MSKLTDTQLVILGAAAQRDGHYVLPLPETLKGGAAHKVVGALLSRGLIEEAAAPPRPSTSGAPKTMASASCCASPTRALPPSASKRPTLRPRRPLTHRPRPRGLRKTAPDAEAAPTAPTPREGTKQAALIAMLRSNEGATIAEVFAATGWQQHTVRGAIAGALKCPSAEHLETDARLI